MPFVGRCHICKRKIKFPDAAMGMSIACPRCHNQFSAFPYEEGQEASASAHPITGAVKAGKAPAHDPAESHVEFKMPALGSAPVPELEETSVPAPGWISPWGVVSFVLATVALLMASVGGTRMQAVTFALIGVMAAVVGAVATGAKRQTKDQVWLVIGGTLSGLALIVALLAPGLLNARWPMDFALPKVEADKLTAVPRDSPRGTGKVLAADDSADAATEALRQHDLILRVETVKTGRLADKGKALFVLIHFRLANIGGAPIKSEGFGTDKHVPVLIDGAGRPCAFLEQRQRVPAKGDPVFEIPPTRDAEVMPNLRQDYLLVFELPSGGARAGKLDVPAKLEIPASTWGRKGVCRFRIAGPFDLSPFKK